MDGSTPTYGRVLEARGCGTSTDVALSRLTTAKDGALIVAMPDDRPPSIADPVMNRIVRSLRVRIGREDHRRYFRLWEVLGCDRETFKRHLQSQLRTLKWSEYGSKWVLQRGKGGTYRAWVPRDFHGTPPSHRTKKC